MHSICALSGKATAPKHTVAHGKARYGFIGQRHGGLVRINPREAKVADVRDVGMEMGALDRLSTIDATLEAQDLERDSYLQYFCLSF